jgi:uncharacterized protein (TIGR03435 family)
MRFTVVSVRPCNASDAANFDEFLRMQEVALPTENRYYQRCITIPQMVSFAHRVPLQRLRSPDWAERERFQVDARTDTPATIDQMRAMVRNLLADRFTFRSHTEVSVVDSYALTRVRPDGQLGPNATPATVDCSRNAVGNLLNEKLRAQCSLVVGAREGVVTRTYRGYSMAALAMSLPSPVGRPALPIVDETGLDGMFDLTITYEQFGEPGVDAGLGLRSYAALSGALEKQVGLKLVERKVSMETLVVDRVERPTPN